jgi:hypothetical protein
MKELGAAMADCKALSIITLNEICSRLHIQITFFWHLTPYISVDRETFSEEPAPYI